MNSGHESAPEARTGIQTIGDDEAIVRRSTVADPVGAPGLRWEWEKAMRGAGLRRNLRLFLMALATYMDGDGNDCFPTAQTLADDLGMERATVFALKKEAEASGWLTVVSKGGRGSGGGGSGKSNRYLPRIPAAQQSGDCLTVEETRGESNSQVTTGSNSQVATRRNQTSDQTNGVTPTPMTQSDRVQSLLARHWPGRISQKRHVDPLVALLESGWIWDQVVDVVTARTTGLDAPLSMRPLLMRLDRLAHCPTYEQAIRDQTLRGYLGRHEKRRSPHTPIENGSSTPGARGAFESCPCGGSTCRGWVCGAEGEADAV